MRAQRTLWRFLLLCVAGNALRGRGSCAYRVLFAPELVHLLCMLIITKRILIDVRKRAGKVAKKGREEGKGGHRSPIFRRKKRTAAGPSNNLAESLARW